jgi:hypothetical protein
MWSTQIDFGAALSHDPVKNLDDFFSLDALIHPDCKLSRVKLSTMFRSIQMVNPLVIHSVAKTGGKPLATHGRSFPKYRRLGAETRQEPSWSSFSPVLILLFSSERIQFE